MKRLEAARQQQKLPNYTMATTATNSEQEIKKRKRIRKKTRHNTQTMQTMVIINMRLWVVKLTFKHLHICQINK